MVKIFNNITHKLINSGFLYVFVSNVFSYLVAFCASIFYAHLLSPNQFGIYSFCYTIITFCLLVNGFGAASGVLQFVSKHNDKQKQETYLRLAFSFGMLFNLGLSLIILIFAYFTNLPLNNSKQSLILMAFFPLGRLYIDIFMAYLRATSQNKLLAKFSIGNNSLLLIFNICGIIYNGLYGLIIATYLSYFTMMIISGVLFKLPNVFTLKQYSYNINKTEFFSYSIYSTIGNAFAQLLFNLDILILGYIIKDSIVVANYKVATIIPFALNFIPGVIMTFFYPILAKNSYNLHYIIQLKHKITKLMLGVTIPSSILLMMLAYPLIYIIFGANFDNSVIPFIILIAGFPIVAMRILYGNILASIGKAKFAMWFNMIIAILNVIITYTLVHLYGIIGASCGVITIYVIAALSAGIALRGYLK